MNNKIKSMLVVLNILLVIIMAMFMYDGYKCLSGFIANNADDGLKVLVMVTSYFLIPLSYMYYFYAFYVKKSTRISSLISSIIIFSCCVFNLVFIFMNINLYVSNNTLGVYKSIPSLVFLFPYDMIIANGLLLVLQVLNIINFFKPIQKFNDFKDYFKGYGYFHFNVVEYVFLSVLSILCLVFIGDFFNSFVAIENILYDPKYIYLMLLVLLVPLSAIFFFYIKLENQPMQKKNKIIYLSIVIGINVILSSLLFIFEAFYPDYIIRIGKPLFVITFSISIPIEIIILLAISAITTIASVIKLILVHRRKENF